jgi:FkbM family methyltransferase
MKSLKRISHSVFPAGYRLARGCYRALFPHQDEAHFIEQLMRRKGATALFFVQIGAHNGRTDDKLYHYVKRHQWQGILVEPIRYLFDELKENYRDLAGLQFVNKAIGPAAGIRKFYGIRKVDADMPSWYNQVGSFDRAVVLKARDSIPGLEDLICELDIECITFRDLVEAHGVPELDLLLIDTEGFDYEIIKTIDFSRIRPALIIYEHIHLSEADAAACSALLRRAGYRVKKVADSYNTAAWEA